MKIEWKKILGGVAPWLATALGGPAAGIAVNTIVDGLGLRDKVDPSDPRAVEAAIAGAVQNTESLLKLREIDTAFQKEMQKAGFAHIEALEALAVDDRKSARQREIAVRDKTPAIGFYGITLGFFGLLTFLLIKAPPAESRDILNIMLGSLGTAWITAVAYFYGDSAGASTARGAKRGDE